MAGALLDYRVWEPQARRERAGTWKQPAGLRLHGVELQEKKMPFMLFKFLFMPVKLNLINRGAYLLSSL